MLIQTGLPKALWGEVVHFSVWLKNHTLAKFLGLVTPYQKLYGNKLDLKDLPEWGQIIWVHDASGSKLDPWAKQAWWIGYDADSTHAHSIYWPTQWKISIECNIKFTPPTISLPLQVIPHSPSPAPIASTAKPQIVPSQSHPTAMQATQTSPAPTSSSPQATHHSTRVKKPSKMKWWLAAEVQGDPATLQGAMSHSDWPKWCEAMDKELATLECVHTWNSVLWPINKNVISSKWVFQIKCKADGTIEKYKVCLVARSFTQIYGIDYSSTWWNVQRQ